MALRAGKGLEFNQVTAGPRFSKRVTVGQKAQATAGLAFSC